MSNRRDLDVGPGPGLVSLSRETARDVLGSDGQVIGRLADLSVDLDLHAGPGVVQRLLVRRRRAPDILLPWAAVEKYEHSGVVIRGGVDPAVLVVDSILEALGDDEILLVRDVLDTQIIGTTCAEFAGIDSGSELFGLSRYASVSEAAVIVSLLVPILFRDGRYCPRPRPLGRFMIGWPSTIAYGITTAVVVLCVAALAVTSLTG